MQGMGRSGKCKPGFFIDFLIREQSFLLSSVQMSGVESRDQKRRPRREAGLPWLLADSSTTDTDPQLAVQENLWGGPLRAGCLRSETEHQ